jgi:hypothetical protein
MSANPNLYMSLKIDKHFPLNRPVNEDGVAKLGWLALISHYADRFLIGTDNFYDAPGVFLRGFPRGVDVLGFVRQLPAEIAPQNHDRKPTSSLSVCFHRLTVSGLDGRTAQKGAHRC